MLDVKKTIMNKYFLCLIAALLSGCSASKSVLQPTYNRGGYTLDKHFSNSLAKEDSVVIMGKISTLSKADSLIIPTVKYGCNTSQLTSGEYKIKVKAPDINLHVTALHIGYLTVETKPLIVQAGDSIKVNFYLVPDERPLLNCEGNFR